MARVAVVAGGRSLEREISLRSGRHVAGALRALGFDVAEVDVDEGLTRALDACDVAFVALHGRDGEDGTIQSILEAVGVPYTGSGPLTCHLCFDKGFAKGLLQRASVATPEFHVLSSEAVRRMGAGDAVRRAADRIGFPIAVKPAAQGSALGLSIVGSSEDLSAAVITAFNHGDRVLLERHVRGTELSVGVLGPDLDPLPPVEIRTASGVFDFEARVSPGGADFICPAEVTSDVAEAARAAARRACEPFGVRDFARVDMIVADDGPMVLDIKTCPGLTETSLFPLAAAAGGTRFEDLVGSVLDAAIRRSTAATL